MPLPNYTVGPQAPVPCAQADLWFDTTNAVLNVHNGTNFVPITLPAVTAALNASTYNVSQLALVPCIAASLGGSTAAMPAGHVGLAYDVVGQRLWVQGSGGATIKSALFA